MTFSVVSPRATEFANREGYGNLAEERLAESDRNRALHAAINYSQTFDHRDRYIASANLIY